MGKLSLLSFLLRPGEIAAGMRRLGAKGALVHGARRGSTVLERALLGPAQLRINPMGVVCNHACPMCWLQHIEPAELERLIRQDRSDRMSLAEYLTLFDGMPPGVTEVNVVGGGEPLVHPQCVDILRAIKQRGWRGYLITNGSLLNQTMARAMVEMRFDKTRVSLHAGDAATYQTIHAADHFDKVLRNLQTYDRLRREAGARSACRLEVHFVLQRANLAGIDAMFEVAAAVGADHLVFEIVFALSPHMRLTRDELGGAAAALLRAAAHSALPSNAVSIADSLRREQADAPAGPDPMPASQPRPGTKLEQQTTTTASMPAPPTDSSGTTANHGTAPDAVPYRPANRCSVGFDSSFISAKWRCIAVLLQQRSDGQRPSADVPRDMVWSQVRCFPPTLDPRSIRGLLLAGALQAEVLLARLIPRTAGDGLGLRNRCRIDAGRSAGESQDCESGGSQSRHASREALRRSRNAIADGVVPAGGMVATGSVPAIAAGRKRPPGGNFVWLFPVAK